MMFLVKPVPDGLPLLLDPVEPILPIGPGGWSNCGWRLEHGTVVRHPQHDVRGAMIQHIICRYLLTSATRDELAREYGYGPRQIQEYISGTGGSTYAQPVLGLLRDLGIPTKGRSIRGRQAAIIRAQSRLISEAAGFKQCLGGATREDRRQRFMAAARLLAFAEDMT